MTEKRFKCVSDYDWWGVIDTTGEIKGEYDNNCFSTNTVVDLLNKLNDENQYLKSLKWNQDCINEISISIQQRQLLEKENEQLKKELKRCKDWINSDKYDYEVTLAFIKSKGYSLKDVLKYERGLKNDKKTIY